MSTRRGHALRPALAVVAGAAVATVGALILGEYVFTGWPILGGSVLVGLFVAEAVVSVGGRRGPQPGSTSAILAAAGLTWAAWISTGRELGELPSEGWIAVALGTIAAGLMALWPGRAGGTRPAPSGTN